MSTEDKIKRVETWLVIMVAITVIIVSFFVIKNVHAQTDTIPDIASSTAQLSLPSQTEIKNDYLEARLQRLEKIVARLELTCKNH